MDNSRSFEDLVAEGVAVPTEGWDFSWFEGRATEARPSWGTPAPPGTASPARRPPWTCRPGREVFDFALSRAAAQPPMLVAATEGWPPNVAKATELLRSRGVVVVAAAEDAPLPFADAAFDLVLSRHPVRAHWTEIARVLRPGGTYFAQHVGPRSAFELVEHFVGPQPEAVSGVRDPEGERAGAEAAGLRSSACGPSGCAWSSTTSRPSSTSSAR